jgi:hypothetical protein
VTAKPSKAMLILVAGPYRSGTNDDPALIKRNIEEMESYVLPIFRAGHIPILVSGWRCHWPGCQGPQRSATRASTRSSIPPPSDCSRNATVCFGSGDLRPVPTKWCALAGALG